MTTAVLVHGGWQSATCWDLVRAELSNDGIASAAPQLPMTSALDVDAAVVRETLAGLGDDAVVVAHSWGGSPVTLGASGAPNLRHIIYLAAIMIEAGQPALTDMRLLPPMDEITIGRDHAVLVPEFAFETMYHDCDPQLAAEHTAQLRPFACAGWDVVDTSVPPAWKLVPTTYVVCGRDRCINPGKQRKMAAQAGEIVEIDTSHAPFLSQPRLVAGIIAERVRRYARLRADRAHRVDNALHLVRERPIGETELAEQAGVVDEVGSRRLSCSFE
jgi:pimeloyl-ACP methyl ester carboxylesterase